MTKFMMPRSAGSPQRFLTVETARVGGADDGDGEGLVGGTAVTGSVHDLFRVARAVPDARLVGDTDIGYEIVSWLPVEEVVCLLREDGLELAPVKPT